MDLARRWHAALQLRFFELEVNHMRQLTGRLGSAINLDSHVYCGRLGCPAHRLFTGIQGHWVPSVYQMCYQML